MQAIILAAGLGSRCYNLTKNSPKALLKINKYTLLDYQLWALKKANIKNIIIIVGYLGHKIIEHVDSYYRDDFNIRCVHNPYYESPGKNGSEVSLFISSGYVVSDKVIILESDLLYHPDFLKICLHQSKIQVQRNIFVSSKLSGSGDEVYLSVTNGAELKFIGKKPSIEQKESALSEFVGISCITANTLKNYASVMKEKILKEDAGGHYEEMLVKVTAGTAEKVIVAHCPDLAWIEIDTPENLSNAKNKIWMKLSAAYNNLHMTKIMAS